jgi:hypothetical protein
MPCYRCGTRQVDPDRGASPWLRGVRADRQVLICPDCQGGADWANELDRCQVCASIRLVRRLGETECRDCGTVVEPAIATQAMGGLPGSEAVPPGLAEEVEQALARVLKRAATPAPII